MEPVAFALPSPMFNKMNTPYDAFDHFGPWAQIENNSFCQKIITSRVAEGHFGKRTQLFDDVTKFNMSDLANPDMVDGFLGGFPCQAKPLDFFCGTCTKCSVLLFVLDQLIHL